MTLYRFDKKLRLLLFNEIEKIFIKKVSLKSHLPLSLLPTLYTAEMPAPWASCARAVVTTCPRRGNDVPTARASSGHQAGTQPGIVRSVTYCISDRS